MVLLYQYQGEIWRRFGDKPIVQCWPERKGVASTAGTLAPYDILHFLPPNIMNEVQTPPKFSATKVFKRIGTREKLRILAKPEHRFSCGHIGQKSVEINKHLGTWKTYFPIYLFNSDRRNVRFTQFCSWIHFNVITLHNIFHALLHG